MKIRLFIDSHEQHLQGGVEPLRNKVAQVSIPIDVKESILCDLATPAKIQVFLQFIIFITILLLFLIVYILLSSSSLYYID